MIGLDQLKYWLRSQLKYRLGSQLKYWVGSQIKYWLGLVNISLNGVILVRIGLDWLISVGLVIINL